MLVGANTALATIWLSPNCLTRKRCFPLTIATGLGAVGFHPKNPDSSQAKAFPAPRDINLGIRSGFQPSLFLAVP
jgi:hypothetical protein